MSKMKGVATLSSQIFKAAQAWIDEYTRESIDFAGEDKTSSMIQEWDTSQTKSRNFITLHG